MQYRMGIEYDIMQFKTIIKQLIYGHKNITYLLILQKSNIIQIYIKNI